jgi:uncharacterized protein
MNYGISRENAFSLVKEYIKNERTIWHSLASEAVMRAVAIHLGEDPDKWGLAGLLHDLDVETTNADPKVHGLETARILEERGIDPEIVEAIKLHNEESVDIPRCKMFHHALAASETITGLIQATTYVYPDKKIASVKSISVVKRMKEKAFAASVKRESIMECEKIGIPLPEFAEMAVNAMIGIASQIGL